MRAFSGTRSHILASFDKLVTTDLISQLPRDESLCLYCASERVSGLPKDTQLERTRGGIRTQVCISPEPTLLSPASAIGQKQSHLWGLQAEMAPR